MSSLFFVDKNGICNYCNNYLSIVKTLGTAAERKRWIESKANEIRTQGKGKLYDCILGVSGGGDSSYLAYWAKENNLRPLLVHLDNGWNSELATENIKNICSKLNFDLKTIVVNWDEFRELQLAYLKSGVVDMEVLTDHAILATIYNVAREYKIPYMLNGFNYATEAIMPEGWVFNKNDWENIKNIYSNFGRGKQIKSYPHRNFFRKLMDYWFFKLESIQVLNFIPYNKKDMEIILTEKLGWRNYGGKHYESVFTKFYQAYILPTRFNIDKRVAHLSSMICSGQLTKSEALSELEKPLYTADELIKETAYILKKLEISSEKFDSFMKGTQRSHYEFRNERSLWRKYFKLVKISKLNFR